MLEGICADVIWSCRRCTGWRTMRLPGFKRFRLQLNQDSSHTPHVPGHESGTLRTAKGGKSGVNGTRSNVQYGYAESAIHSLVIYSCDSGLGANVGCLLVGGYSARGKCPRNPSKSGFLQDGRSHGSGRGYRRFESCRSPGRQHYRSDSKRYRRLRSWTAIRTQQIKRRRRP
jgi:hypothetical protein